MSAERVAVVTGAGQGIGCAAALRLAADGYYVVAADRDAASAAQTAAAVAACGYEGMSLTLDVTDRSAVLGAFASIAETANWFTWTHGSLRKSPASRAIAPSIPHCLSTTQTMKIMPV